MRVIFHSTEFNVVINFISTKWQTPKSDTANFKIPKSTQFFDIQFLNIKAELLFGYCYLVIFGLCFLAT